MIPKTAASKRPTGGRVRNSLAQRSIGCIAKCGARSSGHPLRGSKFLEPLPSNRKIPFSVLTQRKPAWSWYICRTARLVSPSAPPRHRKLYSCANSTRHASIVRTKARTYVGRLITGNKSDLLENPLAAVSIHQPITIGPPGRRAKIGARLRRPADNSGDYWRGSTFPLKTKSAFKLLILNRFRRKAAR